MHKSDPFAVTVGEREGEGKKKIFKKLVKGVPYWRGLGRQAPKVGQSPTFTFFYTTPLTEPWN